jgi:multidrug transporter EmrE-like cation transporter
MRILKDYLSATQKIIISAGIAGVLIVGIIFNPYQFNPSSLIIISVIIIGVFLRFLIYLRHQD